jgi:membrane-associated phospholipid phosphatase
MILSEFATDQGDFLCASAVAVAVAVWAWRYLGRLAAGGFLFAYAVTIFAVTGLKLISADLLPPLLAAGPMSLSEGAPSGHMALATVVYGSAALFCAQARRDWVGVLGQILCMAVIVCVGATRVELRDHTIADVLAGLTIGGLALCFPALIVRARPAGAEIPLGRLLSSMAIVSLVFLLSGLRMPSGQFI